MYIIQKTSRITSYMEVVEQGYSTEKQAVEFVESQLNSEELENSKKMKQRKMQPNTEYYSKDYIYEIKEIQVK
ncbi:MAG: hypothetical protein J6J36_03130 [Clostridia bacterium]|nr:hypothetical protein [Clostridia bacterium]